MNTTNDAIRPTDPIDDMREVLERRTRSQVGPAPTVVPRLSVFRADAPSTPTPTIYESMVCIVVSGSKRGFVGSETRHFRVGDQILVAVDLPIVGAVVEADARRPYLAVVLRLHRPTLAAVSLESGNREAEAHQPADEALRENAGESGILVRRADPAVLDAVRRLVRLLDAPQDVAVLAPMIEREIHYRLLTRPWAPAMREIARGDSQISNVSRAIAWLRANFDREYSADILAESAAMSVSSLNRHFRSVTGMSPLSYQKQIRLQEARRRLVAGGLSVSEVGFEVGYSSASQFSREYRRLYGQSPGRDAVQLRSD